MIVLTLEQKQNLSEDIVSNWYSLTRNISLESKNTILVLRRSIARVLVKQGVNEQKAFEISGDVIKGWIDECDGLNVDSLVVFEVLEARLATIL